MNKETNLIMKPYKLMCSIFGHTSDVKYLCATRENGGFASVSRDLSAKIWMGHNSSYTETKSIKSNLLVIL